MMAGVMTPLILRWIQEPESKIVVRQYYNSISRKQVPTNVGGLSLRYEPPAASQSVYVVEVANDGRGADDDVRLQVHFSPAMAFAYAEEPDFRVYRAEGVTLDQRTFFMNLKQFPSHARAPVAFDVGDNVKALCETKIKVAGKKREGEVEAIRGVSCGT